MENLRIVSWNCRVGGFRYKSAHIEPLRPDILAVQEVEPLDNVLILGGAQQPTFRDQVKDPVFPKRSIAVFSYTDTEITAVDGADPFYAFRRFVVRKGLFELNLVAVWTSATKLPATSYRQAHEGITKYRDWLRQRPTVILGDFNMNASFNGINWPTLLELINDLDLVSAYHTYFDEPFGSETRPTHFHKGNAASHFHLDYCFIPASWTPFVQAVEVGQFAAWSSVSDHVPLIVDLTFPLQAAKAGALVTP